MEPDATQKSLDSYFKVLRGFVCEQESLIDHDLVFRHKVLQALRGLVASGELLCLPEHSSPVQQVQTGAP